MESVSSTRIDAAGNAETTGSQWTNDRVRNYSFTRQFSGTLPHRATTGVDVASFHERHDYETVEAGGTSTGYTQTDYQNGQLVTTSGSGWQSSGSGPGSGGGGGSGPGSGGGGGSGPGSGGGTWSAPVTGEWANAQAAWEWAVPSAIHLWAVPYLSSISQTAAGLLGGAGAATSDEPIYLVLPNPDGSRSEYYEDGGDWWYGEFNAQGELTYEEEGDFATSSPTGKAAQAYAAAHAGRDASAYEAAPTPASAAGVLQVASNENDEPEG